MRSGVVAFVVILALVWTVVPAPAADDVTITASDFEFDPATPTIDVGDTVTFANSDGTHNFVFDDGQRFPGNVMPPGPAWNGLSRTFTAAGTYGFVCGAHPSMTGTITVQAPGSPPPQTPPQPPPPPPPPPGYPPAPPTGEAALEVRTLRTEGKTFCTKRSRRCRRPGVRVRVDLSRAATVEGRLRRRARRFGRVDFGTVPAGPRALRFSRTASGRRLTPGRYALALSIGEDESRTLRFRVR